MKLNDSKILEDNLAKTLEALDRIRDQKKNGLEIDFQYEALEAGIRGQVIKNVLAETHVRQIEIKQMELSRK